MATHTFNVLYKHNGVEQTTTTRSTSAAAAWLGVQSKLDKEYSIELVNVQQMHSQSFNRGRSNIELNNLGK